MSLTSTLESRLSAPSILRQALRVLARWRERARARHAMRLMCEVRMLDDHMLKDIGLSRSQFTFEASKRFWEQ